MIINLFQTEEYKTLIRDHIFKTISYLFNKQQEFSVVCEVKHILFDPKLPDEIQETFDEVVLFIVSGYTYESATLDEEYFSFEAGFGAENFGSSVSIPLLAIKQILVGENPIVFNLSEHSDKKSLKTAQETSSNTSIEASMKTLLSNPENKKLLKRKK